MSPESEGVNLRIIGLDRQIARFAVLGAGTALADRLGARLRGLMQAMREYVVVQKLAGQVLKIRTGTLARSIGWAVTIEPGRVWGKLFVGREAWYGKIHEYGGTFQVKEHERIQTHVFGVKVTPFQVQVRAHQVTFPQRSFMRTSLAEWHDRAVARIRLAIREVLGRPSQ